MPRRGLAEWERWALIRLNLPTRTAETTLHVGVDLRGPQVHPCSVSDLFGTAGLALLASLSFPESWASDVKAVV